MSIVTTILKRKTAAGCILAALLGGASLCVDLAAATPSIVLYQSATTAKPQGEEKPPEGQQTDSQGRPVTRPAQMPSSTGVVPGPPPSQQQKPKAQQQKQPPQGESEAEEGQEPETTQQPTLPSGSVNPSDTTPTPPRRPPSPPQPRGQGQPLALKFDDSPIRDVIEIVMEELGYSYVIDPQVSGTVSINMRGGVPRQQVFPILEQLLQMNGYAIVRQAENFYAIVPLAQSPKLPQKMLVNPALLEKTPPEEEQPEESEEGKKKAEEEKGKKKKEGNQGKENGGRAEGAEAQAAEGQPPSSGTAARAALAAQQPTPVAPQQQSGQPTQQAPPGEAPQTLLQSAESRQIEGEEGVITYVIPLNFIPSADFLKMAQVYMSDGATVVDFAPSNIIMVTDFRRNIQQVLDLADLLDTRYFDINNIALIPVRYNNATDVAEDLGKIFAPNDTAAGVRLVAIERLNAILTVTHGPDVLKEVRTWVDRLDSPSGSSNIKTYIYQVENSTADVIATILEQLYQDGFGLPSSAGGQDTRQGQDTQQQQPSRRQQEAGFTPESQGERRQRAGGIGNQGIGALGPSLNQRPTAESGIRSVVSGNVKIIVNEFNNSLIIQSTEADYQYLLNTIKQLDILPRQVEIEAEIYQVMLTDTLEYGVMAFLEGRGATGDNVPAAFPATTASSSGGAFNAVTRRVIGNTRQLRIQLQALSAKTNVKILDAPRVMTMDGVQATINIGADVPVQTSTFSDPLQGSTGFVNQITFRPTGTTLLIIPKVSASGIVTLELSLEVSSSSNAGVSDNLTPTITRSFVETTLLCRDGQSIAIGGIISENKSLNKSRLPLLGDIPVMGALFGTTRKESNRSELIFLITPRVVQSIPTAAELTMEFQRALRSSYDFIQQTRQDRQGLIEERKAKELKPPNN